MMTSYELSLGGHRLAVNLFRYRIAFESSPITRFIMDFEKKGKGFRLEDSQGFLGATQIGEFNPIYGGL